MAPALRARMVGLACFNTRLATSAFVISPANVITPSLSRTAAKYFSSRATTVTRTPCSTRASTKPRPRPRLRAPESAHQQWGESPHRTEHWLSVAEGNCVAEGRGGEQPEANDQSIIKKMMNSIRPDALASLRRKGEAQDGSRPERESGNFAT